jgi:hypothetical protein
MTRNPEAHDDPLDNRTGDTARFSKGSSHRPKAVAGIDTRRMAQNKYV